MADRTLNRDHARWIPAVTFVLVAVVFVARPLLGLGSLLPIDIVETAAPWRAEAPAGQVPHNPLISDTLDVHYHFASISEDLRSGSASWWDRSVGGGIPALKAGFSPLMWVYLLVPAWYAPGLAAAVRTLVSAVLTYGFLRELRTGRGAATVGGVAYCLSGFMVGWSGWPQANVAALLPGLLWAVERLIRRPSTARAVPIALVVSAMVVSNFPLVTAYGLLAAGGYAIWRIWTGDDVGRIGPRGRVGTLVRPALVGGWGLVLAALLGSFHVLAFGEYFDWADTSARERIRPDTSIGGEYLVSIPFPRPFGAHHVGEPFWGDGQNWVETQSYAGLAVLVLALIALVTRTGRRGATGDAAARASAVRAMWAIGILGAWISYVGGPLTEALQSLPLLEQNSVGRARVLVNLALAVLSGLGVQAWLDARRGDRGVDVARGVRTAFVGVGIVLVVTAPLWWRWVSGVRDRGLVVETAVSLVVPVGAAVAIATWLWVHRPGPVRTAGTGWFCAGAVAIVAVELLVFAVPVATVVGRGRTDLVTQAHEVAAAALEPGERLGGDARTFFANTGQVTGVDDVRGHLLTPAGWRELYRAVDPDHFRPPGSVTNPWFAEVDLTSSALDRLAVGVWAADPARPLVGTRTPGPVPDASVRLEPDGAPVWGVSSQVVPPGGLRGITVEVLGPAAGELRVEVAIEGALYEGSVLLDVTPPTEGKVDVALVGVAAPAGSVIEARFFRDEGDPIWLGGLGDTVTFSTVGAGDGLRVIRGGDVVLYERPSAAAARLLHAVVENDERVPAAVHGGSLGDGVGIVGSGSDLGMPESSPRDAEGTAEVLVAEGGSVEVEVVTSHRSVVVISQPHYPGWSAAIDGVAAPIVLVDGAFPGVVVDPGTHTVTLDYEPSYLKAALLLTALGIVGVLVSSWIDGSGRRESRWATLRTKSRLLSPSPSTD